MLASANPELLLAHAYTLHMALLAGGETIRMLVQKGFSLAPGEGTAVFEFQVRARCSTAQSEPLSSLPSRFRTSRNTCVAPCSETAWRWQRLVQCTSCVVAGRGSRGARVVSAGARWLGSRAERVDSAPSRSSHWLGRQAQPSQLSIQSGACTLIVASSHLCCFSGLFTAAASAVCCCTFAKLALLASPLF